MGTANQVIFDPRKESVHILHRSRPYGANFKIRLRFFGTQLRVLDATKLIAIEAGGGVEMLLRAWKLFTTPELVHCYKARKCFFYMGSSTAALPHAVPANPAWIYSVQHRLLR